MIMIMILIMEIIIKFLWFPNSFDGIFTISESNYFSIGLWFWISCSSQEQKDNSYYMCKHLVSICHARLSVKAGMENREMEWEEWWACRFSGWEWWECGESGWKCGELGVGANLLRITNLVTIYIHIVTFTRLNVKHLQSVGNLNWYITWQN